MGGMAILTLAAHNPELFAERIAGIGLICTGASYLRPSELTGCCSPAETRWSGRSPTSRPGTRPSSNGAGPTAGMRSGCSPGALGFARKDVPGAMVDYLDEMISGTPVEVIAEFTPALFAHDQTAAVPALDGIPTVIIGGTRTG